jgi:hypothetical protein
MAVQGNNLALCAVLIVAAGNELDAAFKFGAERVGAAPASPRGDVPAPPALGCASAAARIPPRAPGGGGGVAPPPRAAAPPARAAAPDPLPPPPFPPPPPPPPPPLRVAAQKRPRPDEECSLTQGSSEAGSDDGSAQGKFLAALHEGSLLPWELE